MRQRLRLQWEWLPKGQGRATIPPQYLYPLSTVEAFRQTYMRFLKAASLSVALGLTANELIHFATDPDYNIDGKPWLNALALDGNPDGDDAIALLLPLEDLLDFTRIKAEVATGDESLLTILKNPVSATHDPDGLLFGITRWSPSDVNFILAHLGSNAAMLARFGVFKRVYAAMGLIQSLGVSASCAYSGNYERAHARDRSRFTGRSTCFLRCCLVARPCTADQRCVAWTTARRAGGLHSPQNGCKSRQPPYRYARTNCSSIS